MVGAPQVWQAITLGAFSAKCERRLRVRERDNLYFGELGPAPVFGFVPRVDRSLFELRADGPGWYWLEFEIRDELGRTSRKRWNLEVRP